MTLLASLQELHHIVGNDGVHILVQQWGGVRLYIPHRYRENHPIKDALGDERFRKLIKEFGGETLNLPRKMDASNKKAAIIDRLKQALPHRRIALEVGVSQRYVEKIAALLRA